MEKLSTKGTGQGTKRKRKNGWGEPQSVQEALEEAGYPPDEAGETAAKAGGT